MKKENLFVHQQWWCHFFHIILNVSCDLLELTDLLTSHPQPSLSQEEASQLQCTVQFSPENGPRWNNGDSFTFLSETIKTHSTRQNMWNSGFQKLNTRQYVAVIPERQELNKLSNMIARAYCLESFPGLNSGRGLLWSSWSPHY